MNMFVVARAAAICCCVALMSVPMAAGHHKAEYTASFDPGRCSFEAGGGNPFFSLEPGWVVLEGESDGELEVLVITVLDEYETLVIPGLGPVTTRVVEERESADGTLVEVSRNFFATCRETGDVFYFGEDVDIFNEDGTITHEGAWRAGEPDESGLAEPGIIMPGRYLLGARYFQEIAEGVAMDRAEHVAMGLDVTTPAGTFGDCVEVRETTPLEKKAESIKVYCPGVGLVFDDGVLLVEIGGD